MFIKNALENAAVSNLEDVITEEITFEIEEEVLSEYEYSFQIDFDEMFLFFAALIVFCLLARKIKF